MTHPVAFDRDKGIAAVSRKRGCQNTDLCLESASDLTPLAGELSARGVHPLDVQRGDDGNWYASFETEENFDEPLANITAILDVIESLPEPHRSTWATCMRRELDVGIAAPAAWPEFDLTFPANCSRGLSA